MSSYSRIDGPNNCSASGHKLVSYEGDSPEGWRIFPVGFHASLGAGGSATARQDVTIKPQVPFRIKRISVPSDIASDVRIHDLKIGTASQFVAPGYICGTTVSEVAIDTCIETATAMPGIDITLSVENMSAEPMEFCATAFGIARAPGC